MFDYIIVGGGVAGCVLANRLSEEQNVTVAVLEHGRAGNHKKNIVKTPLGMVTFMMPNLKFLGGPKMMYLFHGQPNQGLGGTSLELPRGKSIGGSSIVNGMVYIRGQHEDFDYWEELGAAGWGRDEMLRYFKKSEHFEITHNPDYTPGHCIDGKRVSELIDYNYHSTGGPYNVAPPRSPNPLSEVYFQACKQAGYKLNADFNGAEQEGIGYHWLQQKGGERWSMESGFANECKDRPNVKFITEAKVLKLNLEGKCVTGVDYMQAGEIKTIRANYEVIVCAGAFNTPQILMLSGIGPGDELRKHGIKVKHELSGVGQNLQDHIDTWIKQKSLSRLPYGITWRALPENIAHVFKWIFARRGAFTCNSAEAGGFIRSHSNAKRPDLQLFFCPTIASAQSAESFFVHGWSMHATDLRPYSRGYVGLHSADPNKQPLIQHNFCQDDRDMQNLIRGVHIMRHITDQAAFAEHAGAEIEPGREVQTEDEIREYIKSHCMTMYHPTSTCAMGIGKDAVTDPRSLRVYGLQGIRVIDASVFPTVTSGNTMAPTVAVAEKGADLIKSDT